MKACSFIQAQVVWAKQPFLLPLAWAAVSSLLLVSSNSPFLSTLVQRLLCQHFLFLFYASIYNPKIQNLRSKQGTFCLATEWPHEGGVGSRWGTEAHKMQRCFLSVSSLECAKPTWASFTHSCLSQAPASYLGFSSSFLCML